MRASLAVAAALAAALVLAGVRVAAQQSPFLPETVYGALVNELSGDMAFEHIRWFTHYHRPMGGSDGYRAVERYVEQKAREYGLEDVRVITMPSTTRSWSARVGELWLVAPEEQRLAFSTEIPLALADYSRSTVIDSAELVDVGAGASDADYAGRDVAGKIVLTSGSIATAMSEAVWKRGALGIVAFTTGRLPDHPDQYPWMRVPVQNADGTQPGTFAFVLQHREGMKLRARLAETKTPFRVRVKVESVFHEPSTESIVEAVIRGSGIHDQDIVLTAHLQEEMFSANDDASGSANVLEIARALKKLIDEGRLPRPRRDIRFWWLDEISASQRYFGEHPEERTQLLANINQDMVGAKQSAGSRVQFVTRPPWSRASFLGDVVESIVESLVQGNTSYLAAGQARQVLRGSGQLTATTDEDPPFSRPILSRLGTRERYDARVVPFHNNTDHQVFNTGVIGVPGVTFTNWPDAYIHSSDDDLWQMDPTQLKRNAVAVAAIAYCLATLDERGVPALLSEQYGRSLERLSADTRTAIQMIASASNRTAAYLRAANLVREAARREHRALETMSVFVRESEAGRRGLTATLAQLPTVADAEARLAAFYTSLTGAQPPAAVLGVREQALAATVPSLAASAKEFFDDVGRARRPDGLHGLMAYEALNLVDGRRSYLDIFNAVAAQADSAGAWYFAPSRWTTWRPISIRQNRRACSR